MDPHKRCLLDTGLHQKCLANCKSAIQDNRWQSNLMNSCIALQKLELFQQGKNSFGVAQSAFLQGDAKLIDQFISQSEANVDLARYFLGVQKPEDSISIASSLKADALYTIFKRDYAVFLQKQKQKAPADRETNNYFLQKATQYWSKLPVAKICTVIAYIVREKKDVSSAAQFMVLIPSSVISRFPELSGLTEDEERELFLGLEGDLFTLPLLSPGIYDHMMTLFAEQPEISMVLAGMEELVKRRSVVISTTDNMVEYYNKTNSRLSLPALYSELFGIEFELAAEVLHHLVEHQVITTNERNTLLEFLKSGKLDFIRQMREDILSVSPLPRTD